MRKVGFSAAPRKDDDDNASLGETTISTNFTRLHPTKRAQRAVDGTAMMSDDASVSQWTTGTRRTVARAPGKAGIIWFCAAIYAVIVLFFPSKLTLPKDLDGMANAVQQSTDQAARGLTSLLSGSKQDRKPVYLLGIFSALTDAGRKRREFIRKTYLKHPEVCSLYDFLKQKSPKCRIPYAFVVGGNPARPIEHVPSDTDPLLVEASSLGVVESNDVICLNIKENDTEGKSLTWLKFASSISQADYIFKLGNDVIFFLDRLLPYLDESLDPAPYNKRTYGGTMVDKNSCGSSEKCGKLKAGTVYMSGPLSFLSRDLATFVTSDAVRRDPNQEVSIDGLAVSAYIHSNGQSVKLVQMRNPQEVWYQSAKGSTTDLASCWGKVKTGASGCADKEDGETS
jgi:hypothetical protein